MASRMRSRTSNSSPSSSTKPAERYLGNGAHHCHVVDRCRAPPGARCCPPGNSSGLTTNVSVDHHDLGCPPRAPRAPRLRGGFEVLGCSKAGQEPVSQEQASRSSCHRSRARAVPGPGRPSVWGMPPVPGTDAPREIRRRDHCAAPAVTHLRTDAIRSCSTRRMRPPPKTIGAPRGRLGRAGVRRRRGHSKGFEADRLQNVRPPGTPRDSSVARIVSEPELPLGVERPRSRSSEAEPAGRGIVPIPRQATVDGPGRLSTRGPARGGLPLAAHGPDVLVFDLVAAPLPAGETGHPDAFQDVQWLESPVTTMGTR